MNRVDVHTIGSASDVAHSRIASASGHALCKHAVGYSGLLELSEQKVSKVEIIFRLALF